MHISSFDSCSWIETATEFLPFTTHCSALRTQKKSMRMVIIRGFDKIEIFVLFVKTIETQIKFLAVTET